MASHGIGPHPASFRDPRGQIWDTGARILRVVAPEHALETKAFFESGLFEELASRGALVPTRIAEDYELPVAAGSVVLEHERLPFISYPYEWPFGALRAAALFHLDLHVDLLARGTTLADASAYNVQFLGCRPVFIDALSLRPYAEGEYWAGHRQFIEQFVTPLLLRSLFGMPFNAWYRGALEGLAVADFAKLLHGRHWASWNLALHILLPNRMQRAATRGRLSAERLASRSQLPKGRFIALLRGLRRWIERLNPRAGTDTTWSRYAETNTYDEEERRRKLAFVDEFIARAKPKLLLDLGCNTGDYSEAALRAGAGLVIGAEADADTAEKAFRRAAEGKLQFLPLIFDAANGSPAQGWRGRERQSFEARAGFDALIALAVEHHLAIGRNIPLDQLLPWLVSLAPTGVIEFVQKTDSTVQKMLALRSDVFQSYTEETFASELGKIARVERREVISSSGRVIYLYSRL